MTKYPKKHLIEEVRNKYEYAILEKKPFVLQVSN